MEKNDKSKSNILEWAKNNPKTAIGIGLLVIFFLVAIVPLLINCAFKHKAICDFFAVKWDANDALSYYGSVLAFLGTAAFSALALWQNHVFKKANDTHEKMLEDMEKVRNMPVLCLTLKTYGGDLEFFNMILENKSDNIASDISIEKAVIIDSEGKETWKEKAEHKQPYLINDEYKFRLGNDSLTKNDTMKIRISFADKYGKKHFCVFESYRENCEYETKPLFRTKGIDIE